MKDITTSEPPKRPSVTEAIKKHPVITVVTIILALWLLGSIASGGRSSSSGNGQASATLPTLVASTTNPAKSSATKINPAAAPVRQAAIQSPPSQTIVSTTSSEAVVTGNENTANAPASWHTIGTFSGSGASNTDLFTIHGSKWQIQWTAVADNNNGDTFCANYSSCSFDAYIYRPNGAYGEDHIEVPVNTTKSGISYFYITGQFYIKVDPYKIGNWTLTVEDYY